MCQDNEPARFVRATRYWGVIVFLLALMFVSFPALASSMTGEQAGGSSITGIDPGVVVEKVLPHSEAEKAGLQEGDILLAWSRGESKGEIQSPFDIMDIETEQRPLGGVKLEGLRGAARQKQTWSLGPSSWGLTARPNFSQSLLSSYLQGQELANRGKADEIVDATKHWRELAKESSTATAPWLASWLYFHNAELLREAKQWKEADENYQSAVQSASVADAVVEAQLLRAWANAYQQRNDWANAEKYLQQSMVKVESTGSGRLLVAVDLNILGTISWRRGDLGRAEQYYRQALEIRERVAPGSLDMAASFGNLGLVAYRRGDLAKADQYQYQALEIRERVAPGSLDVAASLGSLGDVANKRGELAKANQYHHQALEIRERLAPDSLVVAASLGSLGVVAYERGELAKADQYHHQALEIEERLTPGSLVVAADLNNLGNVAYERGELAKADQYHHKALEIRKRLAPGSLDVAYSLGNLGTVAFVRGELANADQYYRQGLEIEERLAPSSLDVAANLNNLGNVAYERGELAKAHQYHHQALEIREKLAPASLDVAASLDNLGDVANKRGELAKADQYYRQALDIREKLAPASLELALSLNALGSVAKRRGELDKAEQYHRQAVTISEKLAPGRIETAQVLADLAAVLRDREQPDVAAQFYARAVSALESQTAHLGGSEEVRSGFRANHSHIYREYVDLLLGQNQPARALEILERSRTRILLEMLLAAHIDIRKGADAALLQQEHSLRELLAAKSDLRLRLLGEKDNEKQVAAFTSEIEDLEKQYQDVEEGLRANSPTYAALTQPQPLSAGEIQQLLDADTVLLEYSLGEKRSHVFVVTPTSVNVYELPNQAEIESQTKHLYDLLTARNRFLKGESAEARGRRIAKSDTEYVNAASALSRMLLGPLAIDIAHKRLVIVADGALQYVPFAALPVPQNSDRNEQTRKYVPLIADHEIVNLPSASVLASLRREQMNHQEASKQVVVMADPVFDAHDIRVRHISGEKVVGVTRAAVNEDVSPEPDSDSFRQLTRSLEDADLSRDGAFHLPRLLFTRREATAIVALAPAGTTKAAVDFDANRKLAISGELARYHIVHFATHALVDNQHPELSGLVLSLVDERGKPQNGFLDLQDIYNIELSADLVVLSACDTALGKQVESEGMIGLTRGFMYAGAARVVASLWNVDDVATAELMKRFYRGMEKQGMPAAEALRQAQLEIGKQQHWGHPYYWAAFQLQGEWR